MSTPEIAAARAGYFAALEERRADVERDKENSPRLAESHQRIQSTGQGSIQFSKRVSFGLTFLRKPIFTYGTEIDLDQIGEDLDKDVHSKLSVPIPQCTGCVVDWDTNAKDLYVGAWVAARVFFPIGDLVPIGYKVEVIHHFRFSEVAIKDVPLDLQDN